MPGDDASPLVDHPTLRRLERALAARPGALAPDDGAPRRAAVAIVLRNAGEGVIELLLIKRSEREDDPWSGHIALPGGRHEMYFLFREPETGIAVYFLDSIARQNHDNVVVALPKLAPPSEKEMLSTANTVSPLIPELAEWYRRLLDERRTLDTTDPVAVERFNQHAAEYHSALEKTRAAREALKGAPGQGSR